MEAGQNGAVVGLALGLSGIQGSFKGFLNRRLRADPSIRAIKKFYKFGGPVWGPYAKDPIVLSPYQVPLRFGKLLEFCLMGVGLNCCPQRGGEF